MSEKVIWVLNDNRAGNNGQTIGVAEKLGLSYKRISIKYNKYAMMPNIIKGSSLMGVDAEHSDALLEPYPDLVISAGRRLAPVARYIKKIAKMKGRKEVKLVQIMSPGFGFRDFDLIVLPQHDRKIDAHNMLYTVTSPHRFDDAFLEKEKQIHEHDFKEFKRPYISLMVGGSNKIYDFSPEEAKKLGELVTRFAKAKEGTVLITTSRRTSDASKNALQSNIHVPYYIYEFDSPKANPYFAYLALADFVVVTGDSISMCSEALASKAPVFIYSPKALSKTKFGRFHQNLFVMKAATPFEEIYFEEYNKTTQNLDSAKVIASYIKEKILK